jgi:hypothetical protein
MTAEDLNDEGMRYVTQNYEEFQMADKVTYRSICHPVLFRSFIKVLRNKKETHMKFKFGRSSPSKGKHIEKLIYLDYPKNSRQKLNKPFR